MSKIISDLIEYNQTVRPLVVDLCHSLFANLKFNAFGYTRVNKNGSRFILETNEQWLQHYSSIGFFENFDHERSLFTNMSKAESSAYHSLVLTGQPESDIHKSLYDLNLWNSMSLYVKNKDCVEAFHFSTKRNNTDIINLYVNHQDLILRFAQFFREKVGHIIGNKYPTTQIQNPGDLDVIFNNERLTETDVDEFIKDTNLRKVYLPTHDIYLSKREAECLHHVCNGRSIKYIANLIDISPRTVEKYLSNMRTKLGVMFKSELVEIGKTNLIGDMNLV